MNAAVTATEPPSEIAGFAITAPLLSWFPGDRHRHALCWRQDVFPDQLRARTKAFAIDIVGFCRQLPRNDEGLVVRRQLLRAGTSVGANYRAVCRPRSDADFISKLGTVIEECDETAFWLELAVDIQLVEPTQAAALLGEADELVRIFVASRETVRRRLPPRGIRRS